MTGMNFFIPTTLTVGTHFFFVEVRATGGAAPVRSTVMVVTVSAPDTPVITITTQPAPETIVRVGNISGSLRVAATVSGGWTPSIQWFTNTTNSNVSGYTMVTGVTGAILAIPNALGLGARYFFAEVTAPGAAPVRSNVARVYVTDLMPLDPPTNVWLTQNGWITFTPGANNTAVGDVSFTYTLFRDGEAVAGFIDQSIVAGYPFVNAVLRKNAMLNEAGAYTVRVTAHAGAAGFTPASSASASNAMNVFAVNVTIDGGNGTDMVGIGPSDMVSGGGQIQSHTATFTMRAFAGATFSLTAFPEGFRLMTWAGAGSGEGHVRTITDINANVAITATFAAPVITFTQHPATPINVRLGGGGSLSVAASVTGNGTVYFQWFVTNENSNEHGNPVIPEAGGSIFTFSTRDLGVGTHYFFAQATASEAATVRSNVAVVTVVDPMITFTQHPATPVNVVVGGGGSLSVAASVTGGGTISFQWFETNENSNVGGSPINGATGASFAIPTDLALGTHYFFVQATADGVANVRSNVAVVTVSAPVITIITQPTAVTAVTEGNITGSLSVEASVTGGATLSYQWFSNTSASNVGGTELPGMTGTSFTIPTDLTAGQRFFFVEVRASGGAAPVRSTVATVAVRQPPLPVEMIRVQGGSFERGRELGPFGWDTTPVYQIWISAFYLGRYQVTREQWTAVMTGNPNDIPVTHHLWSTAAANAQEAAAGFNIHRRPVQWVSWYDAIVFSNRMSMQRGLTPAYELPNQWPGATSWSSDPDTWGSPPTSLDSHNSTPVKLRWENVRIVPGSTGYRLPTEAQWEFAAKGGNAPGPYAFAGSNVATAVGWIGPPEGGNSGNSPRMVGLLPANGLELHDMSGNVYEWVWDWQGVYTAHPSTDPVGPSSGVWRQLRGGGSGSFTQSALNVDRGGNPPTARSPHVGFRVARP